MEGRRFERVAEAIRLEITEMIAYDLEDPRLAGLEVTDVQVSPDMKKVAVSVHIPAQGEEAEKILEVLKTTKAYFRKELAQRIDLFYTPEIYFNSAMNLGPRARVTDLLKRIQKGRPKD
ncbi:30S ribosome-binding factor RbfA [Bryobacter aggregatus]|uniref:30S ribosome-binding factor RbfA n=1 Tax=Bryobacter aggregatus TaxID=360054 RepID=UPI0004E11434|nr:30S ribosome-binding factor RbfA [Bryobacter aggregatus]